MAEVQQSKPAGGPSTLSAVARFTEWLYLPSGHLDLLRRLTALATLPIGIIVFNWTKGGPGPYIVPAWRFHQHLLILPLPPAPLTEIAFLSAAIACLLMTLGFKQKWIIAIPVLVGAYFGCRDFWAMGSHFVLLLWTYLVALLFARPGKNCSRRLIQLSVFLCYFYSAVQKLLSPDFIMGYSMQAEMSDGWCFNAYAANILHLGAAPFIFWQLFSWMTVGLELFLAFGLFSKRFRKTALILGLLFHIGISAMLDFYISLFSVAILVGYLAFIDRKSEVAQETPPALDANANQAGKSALEPILAGAFALVMCAVPLRVYASTERPLNDVTMLDRTPWSFCMFLQRLDENKVDVRYRTTNGDWHKIALSDRWRTQSACTDNELYSICSWVLHRYPEATEVTADIEFRVNKRWTQRKSIHATRQQTDLVRVVSIR